VDALLDTGSTHSFCDPSVFAELGVQTNGRAIAAYVCDDTPSPWPCFTVDLAIAATVAGIPTIRFRDLNVSTQPLRADGVLPYRAVIGNDLLQFFLLTVDGVRRRYRLELPI